MLASRTSFFLVVSLIQEFLNLSKRSTQERVALCGGLGNHLNVSPFAAFAAAMATIYLLKDFLD
jgi:hypothetical protein